MKIKLTYSTCCPSETCIYKSECANHETAGQFRNEDGITPDWEDRPGYGPKEVECLTADQPVDETCSEWLTAPKNYKQWGEVTSEQLMEIKSRNFQI